MSAEWAPPDFLDAFKAQLEAVGGLSGVTIFTATPSADIDTSDKIILAHGDVTGTTPWAALGQLRRDDMFTIPCRIVALRPGAGETVAAACRDRVETLFELVLEELKDLPNVGQQTLMSSDISYTLSQGPVAEVPNSRACVLDFTFTVQCRVAT